MDHEGENPLVVRAGSIKYAASSFLLMCAVISSVCFLLESHDKGCN